MIITWIEDNHVRLAALIQPLLDDENEVYIYGSLNEVNEDIETIASSDAIILDIILPTIDTGKLPLINKDELYAGYIILSRLRAEYNYEGVVVICSSVLNPLVYDQLIDELKVPKEHILRKPVRPSRLKEVVMQALAKQNEAR